MKEMAWNVCGISLMNQVITEFFWTKHFQSQFSYVGYSVGGLGFEITCWTEGTITEDFAMDCWRRSSYHMDVILTRGQWYDLAQFGCYIDYSFANCWFAKQLQYL